MSRVRTMRLLRSCLVGLFALAQIAGVSTLICDHTLNVYETTPVLSHHLSLPEIKSGRTGDAILPGAAWQ